MHIAIVGAGSLGWAYGARLAIRGGCEVTLVGRHPAPSRSLRLERADTADFVEWAAPVVTELPSADVILCAVRYEQLSSVAEVLRAARSGAAPAHAAAPVVVFTPMMPQDHAQLSAVLGGRVVTAMPSVVAYAREPGVIRHWIPRVAVTLIDAAMPAPTGAELVARLEQAGVPARLERNVLERNVATTVSFLPLAFGIDVADGVTPLLADGPLLALALEAVREGRELGKRFGAAAPWTGVLARFLGPLMLKVGIGLVRSRAPEVLLYADDHFGRKLHAQNVAMAQAMIALCLEKGAKSSALQMIAERLAQA